MENQSENLTPLMRQFWDIKSLHKDKILLFRMGDFYEMFFEDAVKAAPILGIALTSRNKKSKDETPMCGVPYHSIAGPINKLLKHGLKVAICDQIEDPKLAKGIVKRAVTRVLTPGMVYDSDTLEGTQAHYIAAWEDSCLACLDITTGESFYFLGVDANTFKRLLAILPIVEIVKEASLATDLNSYPQLTVSSHNFQEIFSEKIPQAAQRLLSYVKNVGSSDLIKTIKPFEYREIQGRMDLNSITIRHLELFYNSRGESFGTLFSVINKTQTSAGARLLRSKLSFPLIVKDQIESRLNQVERWTKDPALTKRIREALSQMGDIERRLGKIAQPQCNARDLLALSESALVGLESLKLAGYEISAQSVLDLIEKIQNTIVEEPPLQIKQGHLIKKGVSVILDELILLSTDSQVLLSEMENREKEKTGISSLKIRYNNIFGYYIEVTHTHKDKVPTHYMRKQTLTSAERYCTDELIELEKKVLSAQTRRFELETEIFEELRQSILSEVSSLLKIAAESAELDVVTALAWLALEKKYQRPSFTTAGIHLVNSRHPVVEQTVKGVFTPNSLKIERGGCLLLTGPNMAGKSTLMRQVALIAILAQIGSFVPAEAASLPIFDHLFTRIGASDQLAEGLSTFMVEMIETSEMIKKASANSLLILDEVGRGTSTFDGMSLAQAILEYIIKDIHAMTLFATHYHELTTMEQKFKELKNAHIKVAERNGEIHFLHTLVTGPAGKSYGIHVAKIAGLPSSVTKRAEVLLKNHEKNQLAETSQLSLLDMGTKLEQNPLIKEILDLQVTNITPLQAIQKINQWQEDLAEKYENQ